MCGIDDRYPQGVSLHTFGSPLRHKADCCRRSYCHMLTLANVPRCLFSPIWHGTPLDGAMTLSVLKKLSIHSTRVLYWDASAINSTQQPWRSGSRVETSSRFLRLRKPDVLILETCNSLRHCADNSANSRAV